MEPLWSPDNWPCAWGPIVSREGAPHLCTAPPSGLSLFVGEAQGSDKCVVNE